MAAAPGAGAGAGGAGAAKQPNIVVRLWKKAGITPIDVTLGVKGALPSVIALAAFEASSWHNIYTTIGYLVAIMAHLSLAMQPRAKFIQSMFFSLIFTCTGAAVSLLQIRCAIAARGVTRSPYSASENTVTAVWLCITVFLSNALRAARPQLMVPVIQYSIFTVVASITSASFATMDQGEAFVRKLLITFLTGFAIGTGVNLFIFPVTSRTIVGKQLGGMNGIFKGLIATHGAFMGTMSTNGPDSPEHQAQAKKYKALIEAMTGLYGKIRLELGFARKEIAYGKFRPEHLTEIFYCMRSILQPFMGMAAFMDIANSIKTYRENREEIPGAQQTLEAVRQLEEEEWTEVMLLSRDAFARLRVALIGGLTHVNYLLEFEKRPKKGKKDVEEKAGEPQPGDPEFAAHLETEIRAYRKQREEVISAWASRKGISLPNHFINKDEDEKGTALQHMQTTAARAQTNQQQLFLILFLNYLTSRLGLSILDYVKLADARVQDGTMKNKRLIFPGWKRLRKLIEDVATSGDADNAIGNEVTTGANIYLGDGLKKRKDPEHLPPANAYEKLGNYVRKIPAALSSEAAHFGFRAMVATISIGIIGFLSATRAFFLLQRGLWAVIMTAISMDPHSGQSIFGFAARALGTVVAMAVSLVIWYMCDHKHAAIIPVYGVWASLCFIFLMKKPEFAMLAIIGSVTTILIIGYELQVGVLGKKVATSNGQEYYPIGLLAPYRFVAVVIGLGVAFFWTIFPYPLTTHGTLRRDSGNALYLLANFYSCVHSTLEARLAMGPAINHIPPSHPVAKLDIARLKVFNKSLLMLTRLREYHKFTKFEPPVGGKFPSDTYNELIGSISHVFTHLALIAYSSRTFVQDPRELSHINSEGSYLEAVETDVKIKRTPDNEEEDFTDEDEAAWLTAFRSFAGHTALTSHAITSQLCLLSASLRNSTPLPPYLEQPRMLDPAEGVEASDPTLLSVDHFSHPCYAAFAVAEVSSAFIQAEMRKITRLVRELVGEVDFSFHVVGTGPGSIGNMIYELGQMNGKAGAHAKEPEKHHHKHHWKRKGD